MNRNSEEERIRGLFLELRRQDEQSAPGFAEVWEGARCRHRQARPFTRNLRFAAGLATTLALFAVLFLLHPRVERKPVSDQYVAFSISQWQAVTDSLLDVPDNTLLTTVPNLDYSNLKPGMYPWQEDQQEGRRLL